MSETNEPRDERDEVPDESAPDEFDVLRDAVAAYALDAVDADERAAVERALAGDADLQGDADGFAETAALLAGATEAVEPPPGLKSRLMAQLDGLPQQQAPAAQPAEAVTSDEPAISAEAETAAERSTSAETATSADRPLGRAQAHARRRWFERPGALLGVAAAAILLIAGTVVGVAWSGPNGWGAQREMAAIAEAPDAQSQTHEVPGGGEITLVTSAEQGRSGVVVAGLPELGADQTYELWYIDDSGAASAGTFDVSGDETWRVLEGSFTPGVAVGVTVEPAGGSPQPTTEPIVVIPT